MESLPSRVVPLKDALTEVIGGLQDLRGALRQTNDPEINEFYSSVLDAAATVLRQQEEAPSATVADDLANIYSLLARRRIRRSDPELGDLKALSDLRAARGNLLADLTEALAAASSLGLNPRDPKLGLLPGLEVSRSGMEGRLAALDRRLSDVLHIVENKIRPYGKAAQDISELQGDIVDHYTKTVQAEISIAHVEVAIAAMIDLVALTRSVELVARLTAGFLATVKGAAAKFTKAVAHGAGLLSRPVERIVSGTHALVRRILLTRRSILVAEVPRSGDRWKQVNFNLSTYRNYFGVPEGVSKPVVFRQVHSDGTLAPPEHRTAVAVASRNYRFEIGAASGLPYPKDGHPIVLFNKVDEAEFHYMLLLPGDSGYRPVQSFLEALLPNATGKRRVVASIGALRRAWPASPLLSDMRGS